MSIYANPVYNNPTAIPYKKLNEEEKPQFLRGLITLDKSAKDYHRRRHRTASAISCLLCSLAITLTCLATILALYGVFGRCFQAQDVDTEDFKKFMQMLQSKVNYNSEQQKLGSSRRIMPFPRRIQVMPGPVIMPFDNHKTLHAMCPIMNTIECNRQSFDGFSLKEHQRRVDILLGKAMLNGKLNTSYAVNNARHFYRHCVKDFDAEKQPILRHFANRLMEIKNYRHRSKESATLMAELAILGRLEFGIDTLFTVEVNANYLAPEGERPYVMYLNQKLPVAPSAAQMSLMRRAFRNKLNESNYQQMYLNVPRLREMAADSEDSMSWQSFTAAEAYARWPFFDFQAYLSHLNSMQRFAHSVKEFMFVVKTPTYFDKLNAFFIPRNQNETQEKLDLFKLIEMYSIFADNDKALGIESEEAELRKKFRLGDSSKGIAAPYHFILAYSEGQASYESIYFCSKELRTHLPHIASALFADSITDEQAIKDEIQQAEGMIEVAREEFIRWVNESNVNQTLKDILIEKLRKLGISFTTHESLDKDFFEEAHKSLNWEGIEIEYYQELVPIINNFLFKRQLDRLNSKIEALRSSVFSEASAATVDVHYSRLGNWLNIPSSLLTSPLLASKDTPRTIIYSNLFWMLSREISKAIDSEGIFYNSVGVHKRGELDLKPLEQIWTDAQTCLEQNLLSRQLDGTAKAIIVRRSINEMVGFQMAYRCFDNGIKDAFGTDTKHQTKDELKSTAVKNFFQTSTSVYCQAGERGASIALLDRFVDSYIKRHNILGCSPTYMNFDCEVLLNSQQ